MQRAGGGSADYTGAAVLLWLLVVYVLPPPFVLAPGVDESWQAVLTQQFLRSWQLGSDIIFTYGPWGVLTAARGELAVYPWVLAGRLLIALAISTGIAQLAVSWIRNPWKRALWLSVVIGLIDQATLVPLLLFCLLFEAGPTQSDLRHKWIVGLLVVACALAGNIRFLTLVLASSLAVVTLLEDMLRKRVPVVCLGLVGFYLAFYAAAGQRLDSLWAYLSSSISLASGYSVSMSRGGPMREVILGLLLCLATPAAYFAAASSKRQWARLLQGAWLAAYFLLCFKEAFVRQDRGHVWFGMVQMAVPAAWLLMPALARAPFFRDNALRVNVWRRPLSLTFAWMFFFFLMLESALFAAAFRSSVARPHMPSALSAGGARAERYLNAAAAARLKYPLKPLNGTVDVFHWDAFRVLVNDLDYRPRPVFQSYAVVNEDLARRNADFLNSSRAPDFVLMNPTPIDRRYPSMEDNLAWLTLLASYEPAGIDDSFLVLRKTMQTSPVQKLPVASHVMTWGQWLAVPSQPGDVIWAEVDVSLRPRGHLLTVLFRPVPITMRVQTSQGRASYVFLRLLGPSGFILSPIVADSVAFASLYMGKDVRPELAVPVTAIALEQPGGDMAYGSDITVRLSRLIVPTRHTAAVSAIRASGR